MSSILGEIGLSEQLVLSYIVGIAGAPAVRPYVQTLVNDAWSSHPVMPPPAALLAVGVAQGEIDAATASGWAKQQGIDQAPFDALINAARVGPGVAPAFELWRRQLISQTQFETALKQAGLHDEWVNGLEGLHDVLLTSQELAMGQQQGFVTLDQANAEGGLQGVTADRQQIRFEMAGLPPGIETALEMWRRGIIDQPTFDQIVREGHTKIKYTADLEQLKRQLLHPATAVMAHLKGHISADEMHSRGQAWGYAPADMDLWYQSEGRPATVHQIHIGYARGATLPGATGERDAVDTAVAQSDIRPEYADLLWAQRYTYPSAFVLRGLTTSGAITRDEANTALLYSGWEPGFAAKVADAWAGGTSSSGGDPHVAKAQTQLWTTTHRAYVGGETSDADATKALEAAGVAVASVPAVLSLWQEEQSLVRKRLTAAQVKKAWSEDVVNPATGAPWTKDEATAYLIESGYSANDAATFLEL